MLFSNALLPVKLCNHVPQDMFSGREIVYLGILLSTPVCNLPDSALWKINSLLQCHWAWWKLLSSDPQHSLYWVCSGQLPMRSFKTASMSDLQLPGNLRISLFLAVPEFFLLSAHILFELRTHLLINIVSWLPLSLWGSFIIMSQSDSYMTPRYQRSILIPKDNSYSIPCAARWLRALKSVMRISNENRHCCRKLVHRFSEKMRSVFVQNNPTGL